MIKHFNKKYFRYEVLQPEALFKKITKSKSAKKIEDILKDDKNKIGIE
jgi:non-specific serine/threonine protein kinase